MGGARPTLRLDASVLLEALVARDEGLLATYVDLHQGTFLRLYDPAVTGRANETVLAAIDTEPDRYAEVPRYTRIYRLMTEFVDTVEDDHLARLLDMALTGRGAFRKFEAVLAGWPAERDRWSTYRHNALVSWAVAWLRSVGVEPDWDVATPPEGPPDVPALLGVLLHGRQDGAARYVDASNEQAAASLFVRLARQLCEVRCEPFSARAIRGRQRFARGGVEIRREGQRVWVAARSS